MLLNNKCQQLGVFVAREAINAIINVPRPTWKI